MDEVSFRSSAFGSPDSVSIIQTWTCLWTILLDFCALSWEDGRYYIHSLHSVYSPSRLFGPGASGSKALPSPRFSNLVLTSS